MSKLFSNQVPVDYKTNNYFTSSVSPSTVHCKNTMLYDYYSRYLFQKFCSVYEWKLPEEWDKNYFIYTLYGLGYIAIFKTSKYGVIPQNCGLGGYNIFYRPDYAVIANPLLKGYEHLKIGAGCEIIQLMPDYGSIMDLISFYADMMALSAETAGINLVNSKLAYVFTAQNKNGAESFKKLFDNIASGEPAVVQDKQLLREDGTAAWETFSQNLQQNYIAGDILSDMTKWEDKFNTEIGIPNANTDKKERMIVDEVNANNTDTKSKAMLWLETMQDCVKRVNARYPEINISVDFRMKDQQPLEVETKEDINNE